MGLLGAGRLGRTFSERFIEALLFLSAATSIIVTILIFYFLVRECLPAFLEIGVFQFLMGNRTLQATSSARSPIVNSLLVTVLAP